MRFLPTDYKDLLELLETAEAANDRVALFTGVCDKLNRMIGFDSAVFLSAESRSMTFQHDGHLTFKHDEHLPTLYANHYARVDPIVTNWVLNPVTRNLAARNTDFISPSALADSEFGRDFLSKVPTFYVMGGMLGRGEKAFGAFAIHRPRQHRDFTDRAKALLNMFTPSLAYVLHHLDLLQNLGTAFSSHLQATLGCYGLTKQQQRITLLVVQGLSNGEIAQQLFISKQTVKNHVYDVFQEFGVHSRTALVAQLLIRSGGMK